MTKAEIVKYPILFLKNSLIVESLGEKSDRPQVGRLIVDALAIRGGMRVTVIPESARPEDEGGIARLAHENRSEFVAVHAPNVSNSAKANLLVAQLVALDISRLVFLAGDPATIVAENMYAEIEKLQITTVHKTQSELLLQTFARMATANRV